MKAIAIPTPSAMPVLIKRYCRCFQFGECSIIVGKEPIGWHLSISHPSRYPTWDEIHDVRYELVPNHVTMAMILPPQEEYVNRHPNCFHLHEIDGESNG